MKPAAIIDCHTHCYPQEVTVNPRAWAEKQGELHWEGLVAPLGGKSLQDWATPEQMLTAMDEAGLQKAVLLGWYWENETTCRWHNEVIAEWIEVAPERFVGFAAILPNKHVVEQLETAKALGLSGVGELHIGVQNFHAGTPAWLELGEWCISNNWPVSLHATEAAGHPHAGAIPTPLNEFVRLAQSVPVLKMILAHLGGGLPFFEHNPRLRDALRNVYYDTAACPLLYDIGLIRHVIKMVGPEKLLFGSDYPLRLYPRSQKQADFTHYIEQIRTESKLSPHVAEAFFAGNWKHLTGDKA